MKRLFAVLFSLVATRALAAPPVLTGLYRVGNVGYVEFSTAGERLIGASRSPIACASKGGDELVVGTFEGNVFVGELLLCQEGTACDAEKSYPFLGVLKDDVITGSVKLDSSCTSEGLDAQALVIRPATVAEKQSLSGSTNSAAAALAAKNSSKKDQEELARLFNDGKKALDAGNFRGARDAFGVLIKRTPDNQAALAALGVAQIGLKDFRSALDTLQRALKLTQKDDPHGRADILYNMACAQARLGKKKDGVASLKEAVQLGGASSLVDPMSSDEDLNPLRGEKDFMALLAQTKALAKKNK